MVDIGLWHRLLDIRIAENEAWRIGLFVLIIFLSLLIGRLARMAMARRATREASQRPWLAVVLRALSRPVVFLTFTLGFWLSVEGHAIHIPPPVEGIISTVLRVLIAVSIGFAVYRCVDIVDYYLEVFANKTESKVDDMLVPLVGKSVRITILVLVTIQVIQSLSDRPITSLLAGLGVGGLAVALAGQDTIRNLFGSLVIVGDKPFEIGERIVIDGFDGPVEEVGFRSTKIRTLDGHLVTVPNADIVNRTIQNIGRRPYIKQVMTLTVTYGTSPEKVREACEILKQILENHEGMHPDLPPKVVFSGFGDWALKLLVIYWYHPPEYWDFMAFSERVNFQILERFNAAGIDFAFPTSTVHLVPEAVEAQQAGL